MDLAPWTAPAGHRVDLSLDKPRAIPPRAPKGRVARDLPFYDNGAYWHPEEGITPERIRHAFREAERGWPEMQVRLNKGLVEGDGHARSLFEKRAAAVASKPTVFLPGDPSASSTEGARVFEIAMRKIDLRRTIGHLLSSVPYGAAAAEIEWGTIRVDGRLWVVPTEIALVQLERFRIGTIGMIGRDGKQVRLDELRIVADLRFPQGEDLEPGKWIVLRYGTETIARAGQMRTGAPYLMGKRYGFRDWLILSERFGIPLPIATYKQDVEEWAKEVCVKIVENLGSDGGAVVPEGITVDIVKGMNVDKALQGPLINFCNSELSKLVNGSTLATDNSGSTGSYAQAFVHDEVRFESVRDDASALHAVLDSMLAAPFAAWNDVASPPQMRQQIARDFSPQALLALAETATNDLGVPVSRQQIYEETGLRPPINDADKAVGMPAPKPGKTISVTPDREPI
jgi:phage gp29-like protein